MADVLDKDLQYMVDRRTWQDAVKDRVIVPTGHFELDEMLFAPIGGLVLGKRYEFWGGKGSYKTGLLIELIAHCLEADPRKALLLDTEKADGKDNIHDRMVAVGIDLNRVDVFQPSSLDHVYRVGVQAAECGEYGIIGWDSYGATLPKPSTPADVRAYEAKDYSEGKFAIAQGARANVAGIADLRDAVEANNVTLIMLNQYRFNIGIFSRAGTPGIEPGGNALRHSFNVIVQLDRRRAVYEDGDSTGTNPIGLEVRAQVHHSHLFPAPRKTGPGGMCPDLRFYFDGRPSDPTETIVSEAVRTGVIEKHGAFYTFQGEQFHGVGSLIEAVRPVRMELWNVVRSIIVDDPTDEYAKMLNGAGDDG